MRRQHTTHTAQGTPCKVQSNATCDKPRSMPIVRRNVHWAARNGRGLSRQTFVERRRRRLQNLSSAHPKALKARTRRPGMSGARPVPHARVDLLRRRRMHALPCNSRMLVRRMHACGAARMAGRTSWAIRSTPHTTCVYPAGLPHIRAGTGGLAAPSRADCTRRSASSHRRSRPPSAGRACTDRQSARTQRKVRLCGIRRTGPRTRMCGGTNASRGAWHRIHPSCTRG